MEILFAIISVVTISSAQMLLDNTMQNLAFKQLIWYGTGFILAYFIMFIGNEFLYKNVWIFYAIGVILLILLLFFGTPINNAKCTTFSSVSIKPQGSSPLSFNVSYAPQTDILLN